MNKQKIVSSDCKSKFILFSFVTVFKELVCTQFLKSWYALPHLNLCMVGNFPRNTVELQWLKQAWAHEKKVLAKGSSSHPG